MSREMVPEGLSGGKMMSTPSRVRGGGRLTWHLSLWAEEPVPVAGRSRSSGHRDGFFVALRSPDRPLAAFSSRESHGKSDSSFRMCCLCRRKRYLRYRKASGGTYVLKNFSRSGTSPACSGTPPGPFPTGCGCPPQSCRRECPAAPGWCPSAGRTTRHG